MGNMTKMDSQSLREFRDALENFHRNITNHCNTLENGISGCQRFMLDEKSQQILREGQQISADIKSCINPTEMLMEHISNKLEIMARIEGMGD